MEKFLTCSNSCIGFINLTENNLDGIKKIFSVFSPSKRIISNLIKRIDERIESINKEIILSPDDTNCYLGIILRDKNLCVISGEIYDKGERVEIFNNGSTKVLNNKIKFLKELTFAAYREAKEIHDSWEKLYIENMDFSALDEYKKRTLNKLINKKNKGKTGKKFERFFGASTTFGAVNFIEDLTKNISNRYFIKGRPGTGKSTFLKEVANKATENGFDAECYRCSFDPESYDMVVVRELDFAVFDSTAPHELFPTRKGDSILDFYFEANLQGFDEKHKKELDEFNKEYKKRVSEGIEYLKIAGMLELEAEEKISREIDYNEVEDKKDSIIKSVISYIE